MSRRMARSSPAGVCSAPSRGAMAATATTTTTTAIVIALILSLAGTISLPALVHAQLNVWGDGDVYEIPGNAFADFTGTTIFDGSLIVLSTLCSSGSTTARANLELFNTVVEIRGYLKIEAGCIDDTYFQNLRIIRGLSSTVETSITGTDDRFSLYINLDPVNDPSFTHDPFAAFAALTMVQHNGILVSGAPDEKACAFVDGTLDGFDLVQFLPNSTAGEITTVGVHQRTVYTNILGEEVVVFQQVDYSSDPMACITCDMACNGRCIATADCQTLPAISPTAMCGAEGSVDGDPSTCCPATCLGGCTDGMDASTCVACADGAYLTEGGDCVATCPMSTLQAGYRSLEIDECITEFVELGRSPPTRRFFEPYVCVTSCDYNPELSLFSENGTCVDICASSNANLATFECDPSVGEPFTACQSATNVQYRCELRALQAEDCDTLRGSLQFLPGSVDDDRLSALYASETELDTLLKLRRVIETVTVRSTAFTTFDFLKNIEQIEARSSPVFFVFIIDNPLLTSVSFQSLQAVSKRALFSNTPNLCYTDIDWTRYGVLPAFSLTNFATSSLTEFIAPLTSAQYTGTPPVCQGARCDDWCNDPANCWGPRRIDCQRCPVGEVRGPGDCFSSCNFTQTELNTFFQQDLIPSPNVSYFDNGIFCEECDATCGSCFGPSAEECLTCNDGLVLLGNECLLGCGDNFYPNENGICEPCAPECRVCSGSSTNCQACNGIFRLQPDAPTCNVTCPTQTFSNAATRECQSCPNNCLECNSATECTMVGTGFWINNGLVNAWTVCNVPAEFETSAPTMFSDRECSPVTECMTGVEYIVTDRTPFADRVCETCTMCNATFETSVVGTCVGFTDRSCELIDRCATSPCNMGQCESFNGLTFTCNCTGIDFCGTLCDVAFVNGECPLTAGSGTDAQAQVFIIAGIVIGVVVLLIIVIFIRYRINEVRILIREKAFRKNLVLDEWEIARERVLLLGELGRGNFGKVSKGVVKKQLSKKLQQKQKRYSGGMATIHNVAERQVAVKQLKRDADDSQRAEFEKEMNIMKQIGRHKYLVSLVGVCTLKSPFLLIIDLVTVGDLRQFLVDAREANGRTKQLDYEDMTHFGAQICSGMSWLEYKGVIHRDLAARNVLLDGKRDNMTCKVADFGLSIEDEIYHSKTARHLPIKWLAPECLGGSREFSSKSDVWAFGITLWEIFSFGQTPYPGMNNRQAVTAVMKRDYRMEAPEDCTNEYYDVLLECWAQDPEDRPSFAQLLPKLTALASMPPGSYIDNEAGQQPSRMDEDVLQQLGGEQGVPNDYALVHIPEAQLNELPTMARNHIKNDYVMAEVGTPYEEMDEDTGHSYLRPLSTTPTPSSNGRSMRKVNESDNETLTSTVSSERDYLQPTIRSTDFSEETPKSTTNDFAVYENDAEFAEDDDARDDGNGEEAYEMASSK